MKNLRWIILFAVLAACIFTLTAETNYPKLDQRVNDFTNTLSYQEWQNIDKELKGYEDTVSTQIVVLVINSLNGESIEDYAGKIFVVNKIGEARNGNGALLVIAKQEKKIRIQTGQGLSGVLPDAVTSQIIKNEIQPYLEANNFFGGIITGVDAVIRAKQGDYRLQEKNNAMLLAVIGAAVLSIAVVGTILIRKRKKSK